MDIVHQVNSIGIGNAPEHDMNHIGVVIAGLLGGAVGFVASALLAIEFAKAKGVSAREGAHGYLGLLAGMVGGFVTLMVAMLCTLSWQGVTDPILLFTGILAGLLTILVVGFCALGIYWYSIPKLLNRNGPAPQLHIEIILPAELANELSSIKASLSCNSRERPVVYLSPEIMQTADGKSLLVGRVELYYQASWRLLALELPDQRSIMFKLPLPADPTRTAQHRQWSAWRMADQVIPPTPFGTKLVNSETASFSMRHRIEFWLEP